MVDWATISALATAGGTLVLAVATFASVRSGNRAARLAERTLELGLRPLLMPSRLEDPGQKIQWVDEHWAHLKGGRASADIADGNIYLAMSVRNAGTGIAVLQAWFVLPGFPTAGGSRTEPDRFRPHSRDLYIPAGEVGFWQAAIRDPNDATYAGLVDAIQGRRPFTVDVLYGDHESGRRTISRFTIRSAGESEDWLCAVVRHWNLDRPEG
jgi:hypothetical protein